MPFLELALGKTVSQIKQRSQQINVLPIGYKVENDSLSSSILNLCKIEALNFCAIVLK